MKVEIMHDRKAIRLTTKRSFKCEKITVQGFLPLCLVAQGRNAMSSILQTSSLGSSHLTKPKTAYFVPSISARFVVVSYLSPPQQLTTSPTHHRRQCWRRTQAT